MGRKLFKSSLSPDLFTGATSPTFKSSGNALVSSEKLKIPVRDGAMCSVQSLSALLGIPKIQVALLFTSFLTTFMTCKTEKGLNLNSTVAVLTWAVGDCSSLGCILWDHQ